MCHNCGCTVMCSYCLCSFFLIIFVGDSYALHASRLLGESPEVHGQGSHATRETKKWVGGFFFYFLRNVLLEIYFHPKRICGKSSTFWSLCCSVGLQSHPLYLPSHSTGAYYHVPACHWPQGYRFARGTTESHAMVIHTSSYLINIC